MNGARRPTDSRPLSHLGLCVPDLEVSSSFYRNVLGFEHAAFFDLGAEIKTLLDADDDFRCRCEFLTRGNFALELIQYLHAKSQPIADHRGFNCLGLSHLSFYVDDLSQTADLVDRHGGTALRHTDTPVGEMGHAMFCLDPGGTRIELMQMSAPLLRPRADADVGGTFGGSTGVSS